MPSSALSDAQVSTLNALGEEGTWHRGCGWYWSNETQTQRSLEAIAVRFPNLVHRGPRHVYYSVAKVTSVARDIGAAAHCENGTEIPLETIEAALYARVRLPTREEIQLLVRTWSQSTTVTNKFPELTKLLMDSALKEEEMKPQAVPKVPTESKVPEEIFEKLVTPLRRCEVEALTAASYENPGVLAPVMAAKLVGLGLLERNPTAKAMVRCTELGARVVHRFKKLGWL
jgi:hypothetical protein